MIGAPGVRKNAYNWTKEKCDLLKQLVSEGCSFADVAEKIGYDDHGRSVTRNACIGKAKRLGIQSVNGHGLSRVKSRATPRPRKGVSPQLAQFYEAVKAVKRRRKELEQAVIAVPVDSAAQDDYINAIPESQRKTLLELNESTCRWPCGDPQEKGFFFCGTKPLPKSPYCAYHTRVAANTSGRRDETY